MRKLNVPSVGFQAALAKTLSGIGDPNIRQNYQLQLAGCAAIEADYISRARSAQLYQLPRAASERDEDPIVIGNLRKSHLVKLYTQYFVPEKKPARKIYNELKVTANGKCPLCGDIGHVRTLDHFIPKGSFPLYSVLPSNLLPCCRDCNTDKLDAFSITRGGQPLHPYFDDEKYFSQKWVQARVVPVDPPVIEYYVSPPLEWKTHERERVTSHFSEYRLAERFSVEAGADIPETIATRRTTLKYYSPEEYSDYLREKSNNLALPVNNWRRVMFSCLADDEWFCSEFC